MKHSTSNMGLILCYRLHSPIHTMGEPVWGNRSPPGAGRTVRPTESRLHGYLQQREGGGAGAETQTGHAEGARPFSHTESL